MNRKTFLKPTKGTLQQQKGRTFALMSMALGLLLLASCTVDPLDEESFGGDVRNTTLSSPEADDITVTGSADGSKTTITWPVVYGASGYLCSVYDVSNPDEPVAVDAVVDSIVDGCSLVISRAEDTNYSFSIRTIGNAELNNKDAETATEVEFTSFVASIATIPTGQDLYSYITNNVTLPDGTDELPIDLEAGGEYTLSAPLDFGSHKVTLRCTNKADMPTVVYGAGATIKTSAPLTLKNINFDCSASDNAAISLSETPDESIKGATGSGDYYNIEGALYISNCNFDGVNAQFIYDNNVKYCVETIIIDNTVVRLTTSQTSGVSGNAIIYFKSGFANTLTITNSTFWQASTASDAKYFVQYNNSGRSTRAGYEKNYVQYENSTFYNIATDGQWANYSSFSGQKCSVFVLTDCIFANCAKEIARRFIGGSYSTNPSYTFANNTYVQDMASETFDNEANYDQTGTAIKDVPDFKDPDNGDFTLTSSEQATKRTGDPRWLPEN